MKKRILALFLCLLMIIAVFAGCGSKADTRPDEEKIIGRWKWTFDAAKLILFEIEHQTGKDFHTSTKAEFLFYFDFYSNGEFSLCVDEASIERIEPDLIDVFRDIFKDKAFRADLAEYAAEEGMDLDTALNTAAYENAVAYSSYLKWLNDEDEEENAGFYSIENGQICFGEESWFGEESLTYKFSGNKLILKQVPLMTEVNEEMVMDIVLTRVS